MRHSLPIAGSLIIGCAPACPCVQQAVDHVAKLEAVAATERRLAHFTAGQAYAPLLHTSLQSLLNVLGMRAWHDMVEKLSQHILEEAHNFNMESLVRMPHAHVRARHACMRGARAGLRVHARKCTARSGPAPRVAFQAGPASAGVWACFGTG